MSDVASILEALADVAATVPGRLSTLGDDVVGENPTGDAQSAADRWLDERLAERLTPLDAVGTYLSEERADAVDCGSGLSVAVDPLDGSSNLKSNNPIGTILGVYDAPLPARGTDVVASALVVYGPRITVSVAADGEATRYVVDDGALVDPRPLSVADGAEICGYAGRASEWRPAFRAFARELSRERKLRYCGAAVADVQYLFERGGLLCYPADDARADGVLRLQYEANPIAHLVETAGGRASDGSGPIREREPTTLHERVQTFVGTAADVDALESHLDADR
ncbi:class 1 fructose-bisphosphatase [Salinilacihabitans rarus]|uniref:class 1 fructose-bisphosphatase n=1 Tax=Salinilacihabitans rarus TaxID=2961596 RepID=UPI0020C8DE9C|nr:class 1 fructose-bisphosphatase [Salinilacihabitans rarus]